MGDCFPLIPRATYFPINKLQLNLVRGRLFPLIPRATYFPINKLQLDLVRDTGAAPMWYTQGENVGKTVEDINNYLSENSVKGVMAKEVAKLPAR